VVLSLYWVAGAGIIAVFLGGPLLDGFNAERSSDCRAAFR
jgi:hypothetical protein